MSLDPSFRETNVRDSLKKFFLDNLDTSSCKVYFNVYMSDAEAYKPTIEKWLVVEFGEFMVGAPCSCSFRVYPCSRWDEEGVKLAQLRDTVMEHLLDQSQNDGARRITLYQSSATQTWTKLTEMVVHVDNESMQLTASEETKFKVIDCRIIWGVEKYRDVNESLDADGIDEEVTAGALKRAIVCQLDKAMESKQITKTEMASRMHTSRAVVNRLLDEDDTSVTLATLACASHAIGASLKIEFSVGSEKGMRNK